jgi:hypothetical protein
MIAGAAEEKASARPRPVAELDLAQTVEAGARFLEKILPQTSEKPTGRTIPFSWREPMFDHYFQDRPSVPDFIRAWRYQVWLLQQRTARPTIWQPPRALHKDFKGK